MRELAGCIDWPVIDETELAETQHVNMQELREVCWALKHQCQLSLVPGRCANFVGSLVGLGCWAHGRSSSYLLNGELRTACGWAVLARKSLDNLYLRSEFNPSDNPSRHVPLRAPSEPKAWMRKLLVPEFPEANVRVQASWSGGMFIEEYAGFGGLSAAMYNEGMLVGPPLEAYLADGKTVVTEKDLENDATVDRCMTIVAERLAWYMHFRVSCTTWGHLARLNYSRSRSNPQGTGHPAEEKGTAKLKKLGPLPSTY